MKCTLLFVATCIVGFIYEMSTRTWMSLAFYPMLILRTPWTLITSVFLHGDLEHLISNMLPLLLFGRETERMIGSRTLAILFLLSGVIGNIGYLITAANRSIPAVGASGAIFGIIGALAILRPLMMVNLFNIPLPMIVAAAIWVYVDYTGLFVPSNIAHGAHLGGIIVGAVFGILMRRMISE